MINLLRKNQRKLMLIVAILTSVAFVLLYNTAQLDELASVRNPKIYGRTLTPVAIDRQVKNYQLTAALGQFDLLSKLGGSGMDRDAAVTEFVWNLLVLQHEAAALGIEPTDDQVASRIEGLPVFQTNGQFDPIKYGTFLREQLTPRGFTERQLEEVMRDALRLDRLSAIVEAPITVSDAEMREAARILQTVSVSLFAFDPSSVLEGIQVSPEEIAAYFERNQATLNTEETRSLRYVSFEFPVGTNPEGRQKIEEQQKLADAASRFVEALAGPGTTFDQAAVAAGLTPRELAALNRTGRLPGAGQIGGEEAAKLDALAQSLAPAAFLLQEKGSTSDVIPSGDSFYVIELTDVSPARPLTLEEATPQIRSRLVALAADKAAQEFATGKLQSLRSSIAAGKSPAEAATEAGVKIETFDNLVPTAEGLTPDQRLAVSLSFSLKPGELSGLEQGPSGPVAVLLSDRQPLDEKAFAERSTEIRESLLDNKRGLLFSEWLRTAREQAKIFVPGNPQS